MSLRSDAELDLATILEDPDCGGSPIVLINPADTAEDFNGQVGDIAQVIDPDTGQAVSGRAAHISVRISTLTSKGFSLPEGVTDASLKPWRAIITDFEDNAYLCKIQSSNPDRTMGVVTCMLEIMEVGTNALGLFTFPIAGVYDFTSSTIFDWT